MIIVILMNNDFNEFEFELTVLEILAFLQKNRIGIGAFFTEL